MKNYEELVEAIKAEASKHKGYVIQKNISISEEERYLSFILQHKEKPSIGFLIDSITNKIVRLVPRIKETSFTSIHVIEDIIICSVENVDKGYGKEILNYSWIQRIGGEMKLSKALTLKQGEDIYRREIENPILSDNQKMICFPLKAAGRKLIILCNIKNGQLISLFNGELLVTEFNQKVDIRSIDFYQGKHTNIYAVILQIDSKISLRLFVGVSHFASIEYFFGERAYSFVFTATNNEINIEILNSQEKSLGIYTVKDEPRKD